MKMDRNRLNLSYMSVHYEEDDDIYISDHTVSRFLDHFSAVFIQISTLWCNTSQF